MPMTSHMIGSFDKMPAEPTHITQTLVFPLLTPATLELQVSFYMKAQYHILCCQHTGYLK